ncbi:MAG: hypothetical protein KGH89_01080 [Thaumarchaeota archaeon]|nr:hypothetical protein [Nitrososphaerota archaeon]MDE1867319.1 hypothetical protein [Nitrososphaerota archaeon]
MIGKLVAFGIIAIAVIVIVPNLVKGNSHVPALDTIKEHIDYATNHLQGNNTSSIGYGSTLTNSSAGNTSEQSSNTHNQNAGQTLTQLSPQEVVKQTYTGQVFQNTNDTCQVSVPGMAETINGQTELTHIIQVPNCMLPVNKPVQVTTTTPKENYTQSPDQGSNIQINPYVGSNNGGSSNPSTTTPSNPSTTTPSNPSTTTPSNPSTTTPSNPSLTNTSQASSNDQNSNPSTPAYFQTIQLNAVNQGTGIILSYDDTTGQTTQVIVTMKNNEKILFSGTFYASQFHTEVYDVPNTPHIIEMTIQNAIYGTLHASVYTPSNIQNSTISGIFTN